MLKAVLLEWFEGGWKKRERKKWSKIGIFEFLVRKENREKNWWSLYVFFLAHQNVVYILDWVDVSCVFYFFSFFFFDQCLLHCLWDMNSALRQMNSKPHVNSKFFFSSSFQQNKRYQNTLVISQKWRENWCVIWTKMSYIVQWFFSLSLSLSLSLSQCAMFTNFIWIVEFLYLY